MKNISAGEKMGLRDFLYAYSHYVDGFLARRSVLHASLFPEKPSQMYFGYAWEAEALSTIFGWLSQRLSGTELGASFRRPRSRANALTVTGLFWTYLMGKLGQVLEGQPLDRDEAIAVLGYWKEVFEAYTSAFDPPSRPPERGETYATLHVMDDAGVQEMAAALRPVDAAAIQGNLGVLANYAWLLECESRQITFSHGLYGLDGGNSLLVREFVDLSGRYYPWMDEIRGDLPSAPIAIALELEDVDARFDAFGVPALVPEGYGSRIKSVAVVSDRGIEPDPGPWLAGLSAQCMKAHRSLFRSVSKWSARERFQGGATTYARILADVLEVAGADRAEIDRLVFKSLDEFSERELENHLRREGAAPNWQWVAVEGRPTVFDPVLSLLGP